MNILPDKMEQYFLTLPDDVLINEVFSRLPLTEVGRLCSINAHFATLCAGDAVWQLRSFREYPDEAQLKPLTLSWRDYYQLLIGRRIPLYYQGDVIANIPFDPELINEVMTLILTHIDVEGAVNIVFINARREPVIIVQQQQVVVKSQDYDSIEKILFFVNDEFEKSTTVPSGRGRKPKAGDKEKDRAKRDKQNMQIIYGEMTSPFGHPPIYGVSFEPSYPEVITYRREPLLNFVDDEQSDFHLIIPSTDLRVITYPRLCVWIHSTNELVQIAHQLNLETNNNLSRNDRLELCKAIRERLKEIGHIL